MFQITLKRGHENEAYREALEQRLNKALPSAGEIGDDWDGDPTKWAVAEMTDEEFDRVDKINWTT
jgi:hypothetical protein